MSDEPAWFDQAFRADYRRVYPHRDLASAEHEVDFLLSLGVRGRVLDLCCGFGRHAWHFARRGCAVVGLDRSAELLREARTLPGHDSLLAGRLLRADMTRVPLRRSSVDVAVNLFSSFGYLGEESDRAVLAEVARVLKPRGGAFFDLMNAQQVRATLVSSSERRGEGFLLREHRELSDQGRRVVKDVALSFDDGRTRRWTERVRMYELAELIDLAGAVDLEFEAVYGDFDGASFDGSSPRMLVLLRRR